MSEQRIPKIIHYCWIGGKPIPEHNKKIMESWKKFCPDYEIKEWNESNYDFTKNRYMREAFENKQWAFAPDYARLDIIYEYGGIYLDVDVELIKPLDNLLDLKGFAGFDQGNHCNFGEGFGALPKLPIIKDLRDCYDNLYFIKDNGDLNKVASPVYQTECLLAKGLARTNSIQEIDGLTIFPAEYFDPKDFYSGKIHLAENTCSIHHYDASWVTEGPGLIRKERLDAWGVELTLDEEPIYYDMLTDNLNIKTKNLLYIAVGMIEKIFSAGNDYFTNHDLYNTMRSSVKQIAENGIQNKTTSLKLYFTTFRKWKIFETPRANLRYIYHCLRNLLHV